MSALLNMLAPLMAPGQTTHKLPMNELLNAPLDEFLEKTMHSAPGIYEADGQDRRRLLEAFDDLSDRREKAAVFQKIFQHAIQTCMVDRDRAIIQWTQTLVESLFGYAITSEEAERELVQESDDDDDDDNNRQSRGISFAAATKQYMPKHTGSKNNQGRQRPGPRRGGNRDDDAYVPSDNEEEDNGDYGNRRNQRQNCNNEVNTHASSGKAPRRNDNSDYRGGNNNNDYDSRNERRNNRQDDNDGNRRPRRRKEVIITEEAHEVARKAFARPSSSEGYTCSAHFFPSEDGYVAFLATLNATKRSMDICIFTLTDDVVVNAILDAKSRGVKIRLISDDTQSKCLGADPYRLRDDHNIPVVTDHNIAHMHNKFAILDGHVLITGSYNWTKAAHYNNNENMIIMNHAPTIKAYEQEFERLWRQFNDEERRGMRPSE